MRRWRRMGTYSCDLQHDGAAGSATSKSSHIARRFIVVLAMCTTVLVSLGATPSLSAAQPTSLQKDKLVFPLRSNMQENLQFDNEQDIHMASSKNYEANGYAQDLDFGFANHLALIACFIAYKKWMQRETYLSKMEDGSMTLAPARELIVTSEQQQVSLRPAINLADESNHVETYMMAEGRELVAQTDDYTAPCANNKHDKSLCHHG